MQTWLQNRKILSAPLPLAGVIVLGLAFQSGAGGNLAVQVSDSGSPVDLRDGIRAVSEANLPAAEYLFKTAVAQHPNLPLAHYWLGVTYMKEHRPSEAEQSLLKGIELQPRFPEAYDALGILYDEQQLYSKSELAFLRA